MGGTPYFVWHISTVQYFNDNLDGMLGDMNIDSFISSGTNNNSNNNVNTNNINEDDESDLSESMDEILT